ncbi:hypothetical protein CY35_07G024700 [Sphagnum magellanicum]|uniref:Uncharacterized protein n=1 Tax=Sphagnum magellanicum TaxID=128215 RepID=A0ACB8HJJ3_9BRYO|nr:hypothetical protein CY35_07G024700 [Sphagnum magellanicum]
MLLCAWFLCLLGLNLRNSDWQSLLLLMNHKGDIYGLGYILVESVCKAGNVSHGDHHASVPSCNHMKIGGE